MGPDRRPLPSPSSRQLQSALKSVDKLGTRARVMTKTLKGVEVLPGEESGPKLISFDGEDIDGVETPVSPSRSNLQSDIVVPDPNP